MVTGDADQASQLEYPAPPWHLQGQLYGSIWAVPAGSFKYELEPRFHSLRALGYQGVFAGFVDYQDGSSLVYHELLAGLLVTRKGGLGTAFSITHMWVDSSASRQGGREIWGVPKEMAQFDYHYSRGQRDLQASARSAEIALANGNFKAVTPVLPWLRLPVFFPNWQFLQNRVVSSNGTFWCAPEFCRGGMVIPPESPLASLGIAGRRPLLSFGGLAFKMFLKAARPL
ncbi:MAG TPA: acetoacetate decarboxylase family protein [Chloroflexia bacterium]|nr:acetoacetate decarboxylase family protein [Chloroflexia bacterium]